MKQNVLAINSGNTHTDIGIVDCDQRIARVQQKIATCDLALLLDKYLDQLALKGPLPVHASLASVVPENNEFVCRVLDSRGIKITLVQGDLSLPFSNSYDNPKALGPDRIADLLYVYAVCAKKTSLVIDAGTAITIDLLKDGTVFLGGIIMPGLSLQSKALHSYTAKLPLIDHTGFKGDFPGLSTQACIGAGVVYGVAGALGHIVSKMTEGKPVQIFATGGAWPFISGYTTLDAVYIPDMTLIGTALAHRD